MFITLFVYGFIYLVHHRGYKVAAYGLVFILAQGGTPYYINALQIGGSSQTILWPGATGPTPVASRTEVESFTLYYSGSTWTALGQYSSFG